MRNYFIVFFRNLGRERLYAAINIVGLALGLASSLILGLYLRGELTYDRHLEGPDPGRSPRCRSGARSHTGSSTRRERSETDSDEDVTLDCAHRPPTSGSRAYGSLRLSRAARRR